MLRFVDVFASVEATGDAEELHQLLREYFQGDLPNIPHALRWMLRLARDPHVPSTAVFEAARRAITLFAQRFMVSPEAKEIRDLVDELGRDGRLPSVDLLGEAVLSAAEADAYASRPEERRVGKESGGKGSSRWAAV